MKRHISKAYHATVGVGKLVLILISWDLFFHLHANSFASYVPLESIFIDCGSSAAGQRQSYDGRNWSSDIGSNYTASNADSNSTVSDASKGTSIPPVPYMTARIFYSEFSYTFNVTPGPKFIRLHFYSDSYAGLNASQSLLTVTADHRYTLLRNFSSYLTATYLKTDYFFKEFVVHVENNTLDLTFKPTSNAPNAYGFINGIEVVSMPLHLYIRGDNVPLPFVGFLPNVLRLDTDSALETMYRANVGGQTISSDHDIGMFRSWDDDLSYIFGAAAGQTDYNNSLSVKYPNSVPAYTAPENVYRTARSMGPYNEINRNYNLSWYFPVDTGFLYLVRLHFCEIMQGMTFENQRAFFVFINNQTAENQADVIVWSKGHGIPVYRDYVVMIPRQAVGKQDLWLELHPNIQVKPEFYDAILNGVEIFKINNPDGNLAGLNPSFDELSDVDQPSPKPWKESKKGLKKLWFFLGGAAILSVVSFIAFLLIIKIKRKSNKLEKPKDIHSHCQAFHINEIRKATNNFDESKVIGKWEFGKVYKGFITGIDTTVAIERRHIDTSKEQFLEEVKTLSQIRHCNVICLLGYCKEESETILVYEYTDIGSLSDHLHCIHDQSNKKPLTWNQRLEICVGVARGLHYLYTGEKCPIKLLDINTSNILLDQNWRPKISSFGSTTLSYDDKGSNGHELEVMEKTDQVYLFGLVLFEVLSGRLATPVDMKTESDHEIFNSDSGEDQKSLIPSASYGLESRDVDQLVDQHLEGMVPIECVKKFVKIIKQCLEKKGLKRPSMSEVLYNLTQMQKVDYSNSDESPEVFSDPQRNSDLLLGIEFSEYTVFSAR